MTQEKLWTTPLGVEKNQSLGEKVDHWKHTRLAEEVKKLNPKEERALAEERISGEEWPEY